MRFRKGQRGVRTATQMVLLLAVTLATGLQAAGGSTPLSEAVRRGDHDGVRKLLRGRADVNAPEADGTTPLHLAVQADDLELVNALIRAGAKVGARNRYGLQPLTLAATN